MGTVAIGAVAFFFFLVVVPIFAGIIFFVSIPTKFTEIYKTNYPEQYEQLVAKSKDYFENDPERIENSLDSSVTFEEANESNFLSAYTILTEGDEENSRQALKEFFLTYTVKDDEKFATECTDAILKELKSVKDDVEAPKEQ